MKKKSTDTVVARWLLNAAKGKKRYVGILSLVCMISGTASMGYAVLLSGLVDSAIAGQTSAFFRYVILLLSLVALQFTLQCIIRFMEEYTRATLENAFKKRLFANILKKDYASVTATHSGEWLHRLTSDVSIVSANVTSILPGVAGTVSRLVASVVLLLTYAPDFTIIFCGGAVVLVFATWGLRKIIKKMHLQVQEADGKLRVFLTERLGSMMIIRAFEQEGTAVEQGEQLMDNHKAARLRKNRFSNFFHAGFSLAMNCAFAAGAVYCGLGILNGTMSYGSFTAVQQLVGDRKSVV